MEHRLRKDRKIYYLASVLLYLMLDVEHVPNDLVCLALVYALLDLLDNILNLDAKVDCVRIKINTSTHEGRRR